MSIVIDSKKILQHMRSKGIGKGELAEILNVDRKTFRTYLNSGEIRQDELIEPLAKALGVEVGWLYPSGESIIHSYNKRVSIKGKGSTGTIDDGSSAGEPTGSTGSIADEVSKLAKLRDAGILSEEEFQLAKKKVLS